MALFMWIKPLMILKTTRIMLMKVKIWMRVLRIPIINPDSVGTDLKNPKTARMF